MSYEPVIGLEVHVQLKTKSKAFCPCSTEFGAEPNSNVCPVCLGFPGSLPVLNAAALDHAVKVGLALNCAVQKVTKFDRKNYFYPDLPKAYQISQYDAPVCTAGYLDVKTGGRTKRIGITRAHLEEDAGKLIHRGSESLVDYNRAGVPLLEIVSEPDIRSPQEAYDYLTALKLILEYLEVSDCDMEKGSLRCDANVSIRAAGEQKFGTKTELKNLNSFKAVKDALSYEIDRQTEAVRAGEKVRQETRLWDPKQGVSASMRTKEGAQDYRYFPEPDLPPFVISPEYTRRVSGGIPELPECRIARLQQEYGLSEYDARVIAANRRDADYAEACIRTFSHGDKKPIVNWLIGPMLSEANARKTTIAGLKVPEEQLVELAGFVQRQEISNLAAKSVLAEVIERRVSPAAVIKEKNLIQISDSSSLEAIIADVIRENPQSVADFRAGRQNAVMFLVGQAMKKSQGKANPKTVQDMLRRRLADA